MMGYLVNDKYSDDIIGPKVNTMKPISQGAMKRKKYLELRFWFILDIGYWMLDTGFSRLDFETSSIQYQASSIVAIKL